MADTDVHYDHGSLIHVIRAAHDGDAVDLVAVGGEHSVSVLQVTDKTAKSIASFHVGSRITALAWSSRTTSPSASDQWLIELTAASADFGLHLLTKSVDQPEDVFPFGGGLSGHHGTVNDMTFCGGPSDDSARYVATVSDDKILMVWDLYPALDIHSAIASPTPSASVSSSRHQPTAYVVPFPHALISVGSHPQTSKDLLVADARGAIAIVDWRADPARARAVELVDPRALADAAGGGAAGAGWRRDNSDIVGAAYGGRFSLWDVSKLHGGKPSFTGSTFPEGAHRFRWCPTHPDFFAISTKATPARVHVHSAAYPHAEPTTFTLAARPQRVQDFDFLGLRGIPRIAAGIGRELVIFFIGVE
ncbi:hypothetical protein FA95DRAFT_1537636 [Auriscalpium vulgare]|uniref:Uncharacterized protein n=1 Tax=Auriscalpium vulgare TaxID=40419 RepID=A0ACB8S101_9AGAM|nr:hypothetical protein FA95DRAFT_1537636 [Auriscalpium vulgare]